jgi:hypothetical protein
MAPTADEINAMLDAASARLSEEMPTLNGANPFAAETPPVTDEDIAAQQLALFEEAVKREVETLRIREAARREFARQQRDEAAFPELLTLEQRLALPREEIRHRIEGWFPVNARIILAAQFKAGKTTLVGNLVRSLADGRRFLGTAEVTPPEGTIVVLNFEDSPNQLDTWYEDLGIQHPERVVLVPMRGKAGAFDILQPDVRRVWAEQLRSVECGFLCLDPIGPIMEAMGLDENHEAGKLLSAVNALLDEAGVPEAFLAHHMGHAGERSRGDSRLRAGPTLSGASCGSRMIPTPSASSAPSAVTSTSPRRACTTTTRPARSPCPRATGATTRPRKPSRKCSPRSKEGRSRSVRSSAHSRKDCTHGTSSGTRSGSENCAVSSPPDPAKAAAEAMIIT